ncbi:MAG: glycosyltransferase [Verrucomicrobiales bacterium]|nr:glycosyltransferase [Verrucomicrobiales bacterium]
MTQDLSGAGKSWRFPSEVIFSSERIRLRRGASLAHQLPVLALLLGTAWLLAQLIPDLLEWFTFRVSLLVALGGIGCWRWGWFLTQSLRAVIYRYWTYPAIRRQAAFAVARRGPVPEITILAVTYKEKRWITDAVFESVYRELSTITGLQRPPRVVVATGCDADDDAIRSIHAQQSERLTPADAHSWPPELVLLRGDTGKRPAIAAALAAINETQPDPDGVVIFMDGDTVMQPGLMPRVLPIFRLEPEVSAVTTNEDGWVQGPRWFAEWISLRFGLRHRTMCSVALSGKLLCLTGRLSVFRASVTSDPSFVSQVHKDSIHHWLWDKFDMLSGDDKSTWYWLAARGKRMLYVPDALATTLEVVTGNGASRALANVRRWSGNSLRHSWRAFKLGPAKLGWFSWYSLLDQRLAIFTVLVGPLLALLALAAGRWEITAGFLLWVMFSRIAHASIAWKHGRRISVYYLPLQICADWVIALTKIWVLFHPAKQAWMNRGARKLDSTQGSAFYRARTAIAHYLYGFTCTATVVSIGIASGLLPLLEDAPLYLRRLSRPNETLSSVASLAAPTPSFPVMFGAVAEVPPARPSSPIAFAGVTLPATPPSPPSPTP